MTDLQGELVLLWVLLAYVEVCKLTNNRFMAILGLVAATSTLLKLLVITWEKFYG